MTLAEALGFRWQSDPDRPHGAIVATVNGAERARNATAQEAAMWAELVKVART